MNVDKLSQLVVFVVVKFVCNEFYLLYVSWMHEQICFIISFQIIRKKLVSFRNIIAYFGTDLRKKKVFYSSAMRFEFDISIPFTINVFGRFTDCLLLFITCRRTAHVSLMLCLCKSNMSV